MKIRARWWLLLALTLLFLTSSCKAHRTDEISIFPITPGTSWTYNVSGVVEADTVRMQKTVLLHVMAENRELVPINMKEGNGVPEIRYYEVKGDNVYEVASASGGQGGDAKIRWYSTPRLIQSVLRPNLSWTEPRGTALPPLVFRVVGQKDISVPAGEFRNAFVVEMDAADYKDILYYADGVGLIKEEGMNPLELVEWHSGSNTP